MASTMMLDDVVHGAVRKTYEELHRDGDLPSREKLERYYATFAERFGPQRLSSLDGEELLNTMHAHGNQDSLVYWLEFKDDEEFPAIFGSIAGGSALKFGFYRKVNTGEWMTGSALNQVVLPLAEAIAMARKHRDQLVAGAAILAGIEIGGNDDVYRQVQDSMNQQAPDVSGSAWGHKYFSLIEPARLDDYHAEEYQRFHLVKLLQNPPSEPGRYVAAGRYVAIARELGIPLNHLTTTLNKLHGRPYKYWRIGTRLGGRESIWQLMRGGGCAAVGWAEVGDLSNMSKDAESKADLARRIGQLYGKPANVASREARELLDFALGMENGEVVLAGDGKRVLGVGRVNGDYQFDESDGTGAPHRRPVEWLSVDQWEMPVPEGLRTTVHRVRKDTRNWLEAERRLLVGRGPGPDPWLPPPGRLSGTCGRIQDILDRKGQVIVYGPPGTGKTYWARQAALDIAALSAFQRSFAELTADEEGSIAGTDGTPGLVEQCTFHPAYGYEDFLEGYRPQQSSSAQMVFERRDGIFKRICQAAAANLSMKFILIIDEINRGDIPRIFGELLTILERDKRGIGIRLPLSGDIFAVPDNVFVIGTMNTADRSIALLDTALRRRFGFLELMPDYKVMGESNVADSIPLGPWLKALNDRIRANLGKDARNLQIGHAYLLERGKPVADWSKFVRIVQDDIIPLLEEYCYEDYGALASILGPGLVDEPAQRVRHELFDRSAKAELIQALLAPAPDISTSAQAVTAEEGTEDVDEDNDAEADG